MPLAVYFFISSGTSPIKAVLSYIRGVLFIGENYNSCHLWYLLSTIYTLLLIYILLFKIKKSTIKSLVLLSIVASVISAGVSALAGYEGEMPAILYGVQKLINYSVTNGQIFRGMIFIPVGMLLAKRQIPFIVNLIILFLGYISNLFISNSTISNYVMIFTSIALFGVVEKIELKNSAIYPMLRSMGTTIYLTHMYVFTIYYAIAYGEKTYGLDSFLATSIIAALLSFIVCFVKTHVNNKKKMKS